MEEQMKTNKKLALQLVEQLIEQETLDGDEFRVVVAEFTEIPEKDRFSPILA